MALTWMGLLWHYGFCVQSKALGVLGYKCLLSTLLVVMQASQILMFTFSLSVRVLHIMLKYLHNLCFVKLCLVFAMATNITVRAVSRCTIIYHVINASCQLDLICCYTSSSTVAVQCLCYGCITLRFLSKTEWFFSPHWTSVWVASV